MFLERRFVTLAALRWIPVGLLIPVTVLYALDSGLTIAEIGLAFSIQGFVVLALELPSGALADSWGRRPVLIVAGLFSFIAVMGLVFADSFWAFAAVYALQGIHRALDSGALEAWFADAVLAGDQPERLQSGFSAGGTAVGLGIGGGALLSSGLVVAAPLIGADPLLLPIAASAALSAVSVAAVAVSVHDDRTDALHRSLRNGLAEVPATLASGVHLLRSSRLLRALVAVELFWGFGMIAFETLTPIRLEELIGSADDAAAIMGPVTAAAWLVFAVGSALARPLSSIAGIAFTAAMLRLVQGAIVIALGLVAGPIGVITAFLACYAAHGASNPLHASLLHAQVTGTNRATVLSMNSMVAQPSGAVGAIVLGAVASNTSVSTAMVVGGLVLALAAPLYLPAWRAGRNTPG